MKVISILVLLLLSSSVQAGDIGHGESSSLDGTSAWIFFFVIVAIVTALEKQ